MSYTESKKKALEYCFSGMNDRQRDAVFATEGAVLIIAGAGSGKTTVLVNRIANLMRFGKAYHDLKEKELSLEDMNFLRDYPSMPKSEKNISRLSELIAVQPINPWNILAITFTNKAASELKQRLNAMLGEQAMKINASTFHSACVKILRREIEHLGYNSGFTIYDEDDIKRLIKDAMKKLNINERDFNPKAFRNIISKCKDKMISPADYAPYAEESGEVVKQHAAAIYSEYQAELKKVNAVDFDDLIFLTVKLLEDFPDVREHYHNLYKYIMIDEYQDTNIAQYRLVSLLAGNSGNLCVVGDDDQSIYRFRGATIENILNFEKQYSGCKVVRLEQNYRSTENILNAANAVIANNQNRKEKALWSELGDGEKVHCRKFENENEESKFVAETIIKGTEEGKKYSDYALLYRSNAQSRSFETALVRSGIPYKIVGGVRFYERKEVKDIMSYLALINNPYDLVRFRRIINEPKRGIGDTTVEEIIRISGALGITPIEVCREASSYETIAKKAQVLRAAANIFDELDELSETLPVHELIDAVAEKSGYVAAMNALGDEGKTRMENINELKSNACAMLDDNPEAELADFLEQSALVSDIDNFDSESDRVSLMTMHSAKGLEFDTVFLVGAEDNIFPSYRSLGDPVEMEEERRLAYVAITRAKRNLYVTHTSYRMIYGQTMRNRLSTFIREIPEKYIEKSGEEKRIERHAYSKPVKRNYLAEQDAKRSAEKKASSQAPVKDVFKTGERVKHNVFGTGSVKDVKSMGNDTMLTISFDNGQEKKVMLNFAKIEKI